MERNKYDVFISYSSKNQKVVEAMCAYLEQHKVRCFVAYRDIPKGVVWAKAIVEALDESKMMVVVFSEEFNMSDQVDREIELASEDKKPILTFRISNTMFKGAKKYYLKNINWIDAFPNPENLFDSLLDNVAKLIGFSLSEKERQERGYKPIQDNNKQYPKIINGHEYVDLGLPSGLKWATCNVGANKPEEYGDYFAWGETEAKQEYISENYKNVRVIRKKGFLGIGKKEKFGFDISGNPQYDVARKNWGGSWRMPTKDEMQELVDYCEWEWTEVNGVKGSNVIGPNGNCIFLPAAGYRYGTSLKFDGYYVRYWSSTRDGNLYDDSAGYLYFYNGDGGVYGSGRFYGQTVRPITE
ncbi:MAG: TIR domain-containing protein [Lentimicrobiaceae bacterium]|nr:TIR domain-containing protein [Lentimicrobiaceae bacterium]